MSLRSPPTPRVYDFTKHPREQMLILKLNATYSKLYVPNKTALKYSKKLTATGEAGNLTTSFFVRKQMRKKP